MISVNYKILSTAKTFMVMINVPGGTWYRWARPQPLNPNPITAKQWQKDIKAGLIESGI